MERIALGLPAQRADPVTLRGSPTGLERLRAGLDFRF